MRNEKRGTRNVGKNPRADFIIKTAGVRSAPKNAVAFFGDPARAPFPTYTPKVLRKLRLQ